MDILEKIEIEGLKTIHKLCKFGADHNMEGCTFTEIVERMFSKIEQMKTQVNTLDEMLLNQGEVLAQAKAQADQKVKLLLCDEHLKKCESPTGIFNSQYPDEEPCLICLAKEAKAQAVPEQDQQIWATCDLTWKDVAFRALSCKVLKTTQNWVHVKNIVCVGSTTASLICKKLGVNPDGTKFDLIKPQEPT